MSISIDIPALQDASRDLLRQANGLDEDTLDAFPDTGRSRGLTERGLGDVVDYVAALVRDVGGLGQGLADYLTMVGRTDADVAGSLDLTYAGGPT